MELGSLYLIFTSFSRSAVTMSVPLLMTSLGEIFAERSGVINIGLEGMMLSGAFFGMVGSYYTGNPWVGLIIGSLGGVTLALIFSLLSISLGADQVVVGTAVNIFALGITGVLYRAMFGVTGAALMVEMFQTENIPFIKDIPFFGPVFFQHNLLVYMAFVSVPIAAFILFRTKVGLHIRAVGEHPQAADTSGIDVVKMRYICVLISGFAAGCAGSYLSLAHSNTFIEGMSAGRGFLALAIVIFGKWHPWGALGAALFFGAANALQFQFQALGLDVPYQFFLMLPYILTLLVLAGFVGRSTAPAALAKPYRRE